MNLIQTLRQINAIITDSHIVYTSGKHGSVYVNKDVLYPHTELASGVGKLFAEKFSKMEIDVVVAPALGGIILSQWTAYHLSEMKGKEVLGVYAEKDPKASEGAEKRLIFTRGYDALIKGKKVLVVEDITNTGDSCKKVVEAVKAAGGTVVAACVMVNRNPAVNDAYMGAPFSALATIEAEAYDEADCPLCAKGVPINTDVGHGRKYLQEKKKS